MDYYILLRAVNFKPKYQNMETYILSGEDGVNYYLQGELHQDDIDMCKDGYLTIIRVRDLKEMSDSGWVNMTPYPKGDTN